MFTIKQRTIFIVDTIFILLLIGIKLLFKYVPNDEQRLAQAQENYAQNGESPIDNRWAYFLVNEENPLPDDYNVSLSNVQGTFLMDERCADYAREMIKAAAEDGIYLKVVSAYRSISKQQENLEAYIERLMKEGHGEDEARALALSEIASPGTSEHNAGLALDILTEDWWETHDDVTDDFENTEEYLWLSANAHKYGFILRYPKDMDGVTGYVYEPWHYRFVGVYYANEIWKSGLPFEYFYINAESAEAAPPRP